MKRSIILLCLILCPIFSFTQGEASNWYFGANAGVNFNNGIAHVLSDSELDTIEGCATISDQDGLLLFYTDGLTVYNKNHQTMHNGEGLGGDFSSSQSAIIVPKPNTTDSYYIFTVDADAGSNGLQYSEVNMSLNNGLGSVTNVKNVQLITQTNEQLIATKKKYEDAYWVVSHKFNSNEFVTFEITAFGVNHNPIISAIGSTVNSSNNIGQAKFSHQRDRLASARTGEIQIFDFNNATGKLSNPISISANKNFYGLEFSPNGKLLYASNFDSGLFFGGGVSQFNLLAGNQNEIANSIINLTSEDNALFGALQLAPNGKIYVARVDDVKLDIINNPDELGVNCNFDSNGLFLNGGLSIFGLPTFIQPFFRSSFEFCVSDEVQFYADIVGEYDSIIWDFGDGNTSTEINPVNDFGSAGQYIVTMTVFSGIQTLSTTKTIAIQNDLISFFAEVIQCDDEISDGLTLFNLSSFNSLLFEAVNIPFSNLSEIHFYEDNLLLNEISDESFINTSNPQSVFATVENRHTNCVSVIELTLTVTNELLDNLSIEECIDSHLNGFYSFNLSEITSQILSTTSLNLAIKYYENFEDAILEENELTSEFTNTIAHNQTIYARADNHSVCYGIYPVSLNLYDIPNVLETEDLFYCTDGITEEITLDSGIMNGNLSDYNYQWSTDESTPQIQVDGVGIYYVIVSNTFGCTIERTINVLPSSKAEIIEIVIEDFSENNTVIIAVDGDGHYEFALDNVNGIYQESNVFENVSPEIHSVYVKDVKANCGIVSEDISVLGFPKFFSPNGDNKNDTWQIKGFMPESEINVNVEIFNRYGKLIKTLNANDPKWDGTFKGELLPTNDYWFVAKLSDGSTYKGHFTLKR